MSLYVVKSESLGFEKAWEQSPVISLLTNCPMAEDIPCALREVSDRVERGSLSTFRGDRFPQGADMAFLWLAGERLLQGSASGLRRVFEVSGNRTFVPLHLPCLAEVDLIGLQPRLWKKSKDVDGTTSTLRIAASPSPALELEGFLEESDELWACLYLALLEEQKDPGSGLDRLSRLWRDRAVIPKPFGALLVRNLIVLLIHHKQFDQAERLLSLGMDYYPRYAELPHLAALLCALRGKYSEVLTYVRQAIQNPDLSYVGSGGEDSYRSLNVLGSVFELVGNQLMAVQCYLPGAQIYPAYPPSVFGILRQRLPYNPAQELRYQALGTLARREPRYLEAIFEFFLLHRQIEAARHLLESPNLSDSTKEKLQKSLEDFDVSRRSSPRPNDVRPGVMLVGPFWVQSSLARINREIAAAVAAEKDLDVAFEPHGLGDIPGAALPYFNPIAKGFKRKVRRLDLTIRQHWPPDFQPPACGKLVAIVPWEYGSIPIRWASRIRKHVDELWVPSEFCCEVFLRGGVPAEKVKVIPYGVDVETFRPDGKIWRPEGCRSFVFLFVGGAIPRKGVDILWDAYCRAFTRQDDVTLVVKDIGSSTFYKSMTLLGRLLRAAQDARSPHLMVLTEQFDDAKLASLYRGSNVLVLPYRGEGFGMPLAEGLACGLPVITTGLGPAREFCPPEASYFLRARVCEVSDAQLRFGPVSGPFTWFEPDVSELSMAMRWAFEHKQEAARRGMFGSEKVRASLNWPRITNLQLERIYHLVGA